MATKICVNGVTSVSISFCKNGKNPYDYKISASTLVKGSADLTLRQNCSGTLSVTGLLATSIHWESVYPGVVGQYNSYLNCTSGCTSTTVTPQPGSPAYIDYRVYGSSTSCGETKADTIRVYTTPAMAVSITPNNPAICSGASTALNASVTGGNPPYTYAWSTGASSTGITINTIGSYSVTVSDNTTGCAAITQTATVTAAPTPAAPTVSGVFICAGNNTTLTANAPGGTYEWFNAASGGTLLGTGSSFNTPVLNSTTTYYVQTTVNGCVSARTAVTVTVNPIPAAPTANGGSLCVGNSLTLTATAPGGTYAWYDAANGGTLLASTASYSTPALNSTTSYYVQTNVSGCTSARTQVTATVIPKQDPAFTYPSGTFCVSGSNPIPTIAGGAGSGSFSASSADLVFVSTTTGEINIAASKLGTYTIQFVTSGTCTYTSTANITITNAPNASFSYSGSSYCPQQLTATPSFTLGASAGIFSAASGLVFKNNSTGEVDLKASTPGIYTVTNTITAAGGCAATSATGSITISAEPTVNAGSDQTICSGTAVNLSGIIGGTASSASWSGGSGSFSNASQLSTVYTPATNETTVNLYLTTNAPGSCAAAKDTVVLYIVPTPAAPTIAGTTICAGQSTTLSAIAPGGSYEWFNVATGGDRFGSGASYSTPILNNSQTYYVQTTIAGCKSNRSSVTVTVTPLPAAPTVANTTICTGNSTLLTATAPGGSYQWYDAASGGNLLTSANTYTTPSLFASTSYYVQTTVAGCTGNRSVVTVTVNPAPAAPTVLGTTICAGNISFLTATAPGGDYQWYDAAIGGTQVGNGNSFTTPVLNNSTTYYVQTTVAGCTGNRTAVTVNVTPKPAAPTAQAASVCAGNSASLTASAPGGNYQWYDAASGGSLLATGTNYQTPVLNTSTSYYVQTTVNGCTGPRAAVTATVIAIPAAPTVSGASICTGNSITLTATAPGGNYQWYDAASGGSLLASSVSLTTPVLSTTTSYFVQTTLSGCTSSRTQVTATVIPKLDPAFTYPSGTFCVSGGNPVPTIAASVSGTFSASPDGLVFANTTTGEINVAASQVGTYTVQFVTNGICVYTSTSTVTITNAPNASFSYKGPYCPQQLMATPDFPALSSAGVFSSSAGLVFKNSSTGEIDLKLSTPGTYTVTNNIAAAFGCAATSAVSTVTINTEPTTDAGADLTVCSGTTINLAGIIGGTASSASWSGGTGIFSNASQLATQYTPAGNETTIKLYLTSNDPAGPCVAARDSMNIYIIPTPAAPTVNNAAICIGNTTTLTATAPGGNYEWYNVASGGTSINNTAVFTTPVLSASNTYYVQTTVNSCTSARTPVTVTVAPKPSITSSPNSEVCSAQPMTYRILSDREGSTYTWSRAAIGGISNPANSAHTDSTIIEVLNNTTSSGIAVSYQIIPENNGCIGDVFTHTVLVKPTPATPTLTNSSPVCVGSTLSLFTGTVNGASYQWSGPNNFSSTLQNPVITDVVLASAGNYQVRITVNGCNSQPTIKTIAPVIAAPAASSNSPVCEGNTIQLSTAGLPGASYQWNGPLGFSSLSQNPSLPAAATSKAGVYYVTAFIAGCQGLKDSVTIQVNTPPQPPVINTNSPVCVLDSIVLQAQGSPTTQFKWSGPNSFSSDSASPVIRKASVQNDGTYNVTASTPGCTTTSAASVTVAVNMIPNIQQVSNNGPLCEGGTLSLSASSLAGSIYQWGSSSGFRSNEQNPKLTDITAANGEIYFVTATKNGCKGDTAFTKVTVIKPAIANAGRNVSVCANNAAVWLTGTITGEDTQTGTWTSSGKGVFSPNANSLSAMYLPAKEDTAQRSVVLTLSTSNNKLCPATSSSMQISINPAPVVNGGVDGAVCANDSLINLQGWVGNAGSARWQSSGSGSFRRADADPLHYVYTPSAADIQKGKLNFYLTSTDNGSCLPVKDTVEYTIRPVPYVNAGEDLILFEKESFVLRPEITGNDLKYLWTPNLYLSSDTVRNPVLTATDNQTYTIRVTGTGSCVAEDQVFVRVLKQITIPNIFSPNGDGIYDVWNIPQLANYPGSIVEVYTRTGQKIFSSVGYDKPWDGTFNGKPVPVATYYYIVRPNFRNLLFSGSVTVIR
ncbi:MAG: gliding motility-associated C-terminal domain-containing protein [Chitinophagaceae bacterium]|nr:gliding motility-associated C-terminal domain-containing protein [Chitinophagaceae bacterium]